MQIDSGSEVIMWQGDLKSVVPQAGDHISGAVAVLQGMGVLGRTTEVLVTVPMQEGITTGAAITEVLNAAGFPSGDRSLDTGHSTLSRFWSSENTTAIQALRDLEENECGFIRETADGKICFEDRGHRAGHSVVATWSNIGSIQYSDISIEDLTQDVYNIIEAQLHTFNVSESALIWTFVDIAGNKGGAAIALAPSEVKKITARFAPSGANIAVNEWGIVDYQAFQNADGSGSDLTANVDCVESNKTGISMDLEFTNNNSSTVYITLLQAHGTMVVEGDAASVKASSSAKIDRTYPFPGKYLTNVAEAQDFCDHLLALYDDVHPVLSLILKAHRNAANLAETQVRTVSDKIHVEANASVGLYLDHDFFVEHVQHDVDPVARTHFMRIDCSDDVSDNWPACEYPYTPKVIPPDETTLPQDNVIPGAVRDLAVVGGSGKFVIDFGDPLTGNLTWDDVAIQRASNSGYSSNVTTIPGWGKVNHFEIVDPNQNRYCRVAVHNDSGLPSHADTESILGATGWGPWSNAPLNPVSSLALPGVGGTDSVIPGMLANMIITSEYGDIIARWDDPATGANTIDKIAEDVSLSRDTWVSIYSGGAFVRGKTNTTQGGTTTIAGPFYFRFAAHNQSGQPSDASTESLGATGWGPWTYFNGSGSTTTQANNVAIALVTGPLLPGAPTSPTLTAVEATFHGTVQKPATGSVGLIDICVQWSVHSDMSSPNTYCGFGIKAEYTGVLPGVTAYIRYAWRNDSGVASNATVKAALIADYPSGVPNLSKTAANGYDYGWGPFSSVVGPVTSGPLADTMLSTTAQAAVSRANSGLASDGKVALTVPSNKIPAGIATEDYANGVAGQAETNARDASRPVAWMPTAAETGARANTWMPSAGDVGARATTWMPSAGDVGARASTWTPTPAEVGTYSSGDIDTKIDVPQTRADYAAGAAEALYDAGAQHAAGDAATADGKAVAAQATADDAWGLADSLNTTMGGLTSELEDHEGRIAILEAE